MVNYDKSIGVGKFRAKLVEIARTVMENPSDLDEILDGPTNQVIALFVAPEKDKFKEQVKRHVPWAFRQAQTAEDLLKTRLDTLLQEMADTYQEFEKTLQDCTALQNLANKVDVDRGIIPELTSPHPMPAWLLNVRPFLPPPSP